MKFLEIVKRRRSFLNEIIYNSLNIGLAVVLLLIVKLTGSLPLAFALVFLSKWRIFAVRPQFWLANIQANLVDVITSISYVILLYVANSSNINSAVQIVWTQIILMMFYICWLMFLKPKSKRKYIAAQAGVALFLGVTAIYSMSYDWVATPVVLFVWLIGYSTARHVLSSYDEEDHLTLLSSAWGFILAEIGWLAYHWTIAYRLSFIAGIQLPQVSIIILCVSFLAYKAYDSYYHYQKIRLNDILMPLIFSIGLVGLLVLAFNGVSAGTI
jgi:hypothetical protein